MSYDAHLHGLDQGWNDTAPPVPSRDRPVYDAGFSNPKSHLDSFSTDDNTQLWRRQGSSRGGGHSPMRSRGEKPVVIWLHHNGEQVEPGAGARLTCTLSTLRDFNALLDEAGKKLELSNRVQRVYRPNGEEVTGLSEIMTQDDLVVSMVKHFQPPNRPSRFVNAGKWKQVSLRSY
jgi:hypothetical protein